ncbi:MAG: fatty acid desaturase [Planctomycetota bacterium]|nr:fatty acid desaturase [Planctomycetota bacterium]MDG2143325.1 fatty acid desaturase [Planctomycetota bacterium]
MTTAKKEIDLVNTLFLGITHLLAPVAILYMILGQFSWWTFGLGFLYFALCGLSITGGYHRLFSHPTYRARGFLRFFYLFFGAASVQNSALKWSSDHREHHGEVDTEQDPYNIKAGFWWAHLGWVLVKDEKVELDNVKDLKKDKLVMLQHRYYILFVALSLIGLPYALGSIWGDPIGAVLVAGFLRLVIQWHATFSVNSVAHIIGNQPYSTKNSARDSVVTAFITLGEGYHNYHHSFQGDYRNGIRWFHFDPTKWFVWTCSKLRITWDLKRASQEAIERAKAAVLAERSLPSI